MLADQFSDLPIFKDLTPEQLELLRPIFVLQDGYAGSVLFEQGDAANHIYLVISGEVMVRYKPDDGPAITLTRVREGGLVGWSAAIGRRSYTSGAICNTFTQYFQVRGIDLQLLREYHPEIGEIVINRLAGMIAERENKVHSQMMALLQNGLTVH